jgi:RimJ/RimL family protein N-acetyltransferase
MASTNHPHPEVLHEVEPRRTHGGFAEITKMSAAEFAALHEPALLRQEVRHGIMLHNLFRAKTAHSDSFTCWTLGNPGQCAVRQAPHSIVLGDLDQRQSRRLAELTAEFDYPGVIGPDETTVWFTERASELGIAFGEHERQAIYRLDAPPSASKVSGHARAPAPEDLPLFTDWIIAFYREAVPQDHLPSAPEIATMIDSGDFLLWIDDGQPVSIAGIRRRLRNSAAISNVYTPPERRGHGYAGAVTAAIVERIFSEGYTTACLYTDLSNPASNRCYRKIGFRPVCQSMHFHRAIVQA